MKKEKIYSIIVATISFALWFMPTYFNQIGYGFVVKSFLGMLFNGNFSYVLPYTIRETLLVIFGCITIVLSIVHVIKYNSITKLLTTISSCIYVVMWIIALFTHFPYVYTILMELQTNAKTYIIWLLLYFALLITIALFTILQYIPSRRSTKTERMQAQIDELQKQVDELKKDE